MKIAFAILAHEMPLIVADLANTLCQQGDAVVIHYDARTGEEPIRVIRKATSDNADRIFFADRVKCGWGEFSLVQAELNCISALKTGGWDGDYFYLLSGTDLPIRPLHQLHSYLEEKRGMEFIEAFKMRERRWVTGGLFHERYQYRFPFNERSQTVRFYGYLRLQQLLKLRRKFPKQYEPRMGSQWSVLTWDTAKKVLKSFDDKEFRDFASSVWIPDEMIKQTLTGHFAGDHALAQHPLTYYRFSDYGVPLVFCDDHYDYLTRQNFFFARKISPDAHSLRKRLLDLALSDSDDHEFDATNIGKHTQEYEQARIAGRHYGRKRRAIGVPDDDGNGELNLALRDFLVLKGLPGTLLEELAQLLNHETGTEIHGRLFDPLSIRFAGEQSEHRGYHVSQTWRRDGDIDIFLGQVLDIHVPDSAHPKDSGFCLHEHEWSHEIQSAIDRSPAVVCEVVTHPALELIGCLEHLGVPVRNMQELRDCDMFYLSEYMRKILDRHEHHFSGKGDAEDRDSRGDGEDYFSPRSTTLDLRLGRADPARELKRVFDLPPKAAANFSKHLKAMKDDCLSKYGDLEFWASLWQISSRAPFPESLFSSKSNRSNRAAPARKSSQTRTAQSRP